MDLMYVSCGVKEKGISWNKKSGAGLFDSLTSVLEVLNVVTDCFKQ